MTSAPSISPTWYRCRTTSSASLPSMTAISRSTTQDFAEKLGPAFDLIFKFTVDPPPTPTAKNAEAFTKWVQAHDLPPLGFYAAYPGLQVQDVRELLASDMAV